MAEVTSPRALAEHDDRGTFDCGRESMNGWFRRRGWANHAAGISRFNVICDAAKGAIVGYVTLSAAQIQRASLSKGHQRNKPDPIPATLLGQPAIHKDWQGRGYAGSLLQFALRTAIRASRDVASWGVLTHPLDETARAFYARQGFEDLPFDPHSAMIIRMVDIETNATSGRVS